MASATQTSNAQMQGSVVLDSVEGSAVLAGADIFPAPLFIPRDGTLVIQMTSNTDGVWSAFVLRDAVTTTADLFAGATITADQWWEETIPVKREDFVNIRIDQNATVTVMAMFVDQVQTSEPVVAQITGTIGANVTVVDVVPGTTITSPADTIVGVGATVALPAPPADTRRMTVQNTGPAGTFVRIREVGGAAGTGVILPRFGTSVYGGADGAIAALEAEDIAAIATTVAIQFEED